MKTLLIGGMLFPGLALFETQTASAQEHEGYPGYDNYHDYLQDLPPGHDRRIYGRRSAMFYEHERRQERHWERRRRRHHPYRHRRYLYFSAPQSYYPPVYVQRGVILHTHIRVPLR